jgi:EAL domain-containing protein (putative c-di-GMP-specific phosphodiesterase class I)
VFDAEMHARALSMLQIESDLRHAIERDEFSLLYQPIICLETGMVAGFESLLRWRHPKRGLLHADKFIPIAEETGLIKAIGAWTLREACQQLRTWQSSRSVKSGATVSVNVSARQFRDEHFIPLVENLLAETGLPPRCLKLEITESTVMENAESSTALLPQLRALDVQLHIDDFGTGYSSLSYLHRFPIDALKIDKSFVQNLGLKEESQEIIRTIVSMARSLNMDAIAEGVETEEQVEHLKSLGCRYAQGFFFSLPLEPVSAEPVISQRWAV